MTSGPDGHPAPNPDGHPRDERAAVEARAAMLADAIGGPRGIVDTGLPAIVFVVVNAITSLTLAIYAALGFGVLLVAVRLIRKEPIQQAISGFIGIGIAALFAARTHSAKGFFLPGILSQAFLAVASAVSILVRRPYIGYVMAALETSYAHWRREPALLRAMNRATAIWVLVFTVRAVVQGSLYAADRPGWLAVVNIAMGWPLFAGALALSYLLARRAAATLPPSSPMPVRLDKARLDKAAQTPETVDG
ncbi:MAG: hypothetical protein JWN96_4658 [Mycobacterium sp.]|nr:hypothetical protein [Mycobacterium sp.]